MSTTTSAARRIVCGALLGVLSGLASGHSGEVDPPPPPPPDPYYPGPNPGVPPTGNGGGGGPITGGGGGGPTTGGGAGKGPTTGGPTTGGAPSGGGSRSSQRRGGRAGLGGGADADWALWWFANRRHLLAWGSRARDNAPDATPGSGTGDAAMFRAEARAALSAVLSDPGADLAPSAVIALGKDGDASNAPALLTVLLDAQRGASAREAAALALGLLRHEPGPTAEDVRRRLEHIASDEDEPDRLRAMALYALGLRAAEASVPLLLDVSAHGAAKWDVPVAAITALGIAGHEITVPDLIRYLQGTRESREVRARRVYAAHALAKSGAVDALPALRDATRDSDDDVRRAAVLALGALAQPNDDETTDTLIRVLARDKSDGVQHAAVLALGRIGHDRAGVALRKAFVKGDGAMRPFAALGLGLFARHRGNEDAAEPVVKELAARSSSGTRAPLAIACGLARDRRAAPTLRAIVSDGGESALRAHAAIALGLIGDAEAAPLLRTLMLETNDPLLRREAALALGMLGDVQAARALRDQIAGESTAFAAGSAALALGRMGGPETGRALLELLVDEKRPALARAMAAVALGFLLDESQGVRLAELGADLDWQLRTESIHEVLSIL